jgi:hypothetical protein
MTPPISGIKRTLRTASDKVYLPYAKQNPSRLSEVSEAMKWIQERSVVLGVVALGTTTWLWIDFSATYDLGIGVFSGSVLGALPSLLICATFLGLVLTLLFLLPALTLLVEVGKGRPKLIELDRQPTDASVDSRTIRGLNAAVGQGGARRSEARKNAVFHLPIKSVGRWAFASALQALFVSAALFLPATIPSLASHAALIAICCVVEAIAIPAIMFSKMIRVDQSFDFQSLTVGALMVQVQISGFVVLGIGPMILGGETTITALGACLITLFFALITAAVAAGQVFLIGAARLLATGKNVVIRALVVGQCVLLFAAAVAPIGAELIYVPVRIMGMNAMQCAILPITSGEEKKIPQVLVRKGGGTTVNLSFVTPVIDEVRFVRPQGHGSEVTVPLQKSSVGQPVACPPS